MVQELKCFFILPQQEDVDVFKLIQAWDLSLEDQSVDFWRNPLEEDLKIE